MNKKVFMVTFGCQMNESDSELVRAMLKQEGFVFTEDRERADVVLVNTCAIRGATSIWPVSNVRYSGLSQNFEALARVEYA